MKIISLFLSLILTFSVVASSQNQNSEAQDILQHMASKMGSYKTYGDFIAAIEHAPLQKGPNLKVFFKTHQLLEQKVPLIKVEEGELLLPEHPGFKLKLDHSSGGILVFWKGKSVSLKLGTSAEKTAELIESMEAKTTFHIQDLFISNAHASVIGASLAGVVVVGLYLMDQKKEDRKERFLKEIKNYANLCRNFNQGPEEINQILEDLRNNEMNVCLNSDSPFNWRYSIEACKLVPGTIACYEKIHGIAKATNNSERSSGKDVDENKSTTKGHQSKTKQE